MDQDTAGSALPLHPVPVEPLGLLPGDRLRDHGTFRIVERVEPVEFLVDTVIIVFEPDEHGDTLGVTARVPVIAWRAASVDEARKMLPRLRDGA